MQELVKYDTMCRAIAEAYAVDEVKDIRDKALALEIYARQAKNTENEYRACEIRLRAERKAGELLRDMEKAKATGSNQYGKVERSSDSTDPKTLEQLGISKYQSSQWQQLADVPEDEFEAAVTSREQKPTTTGILRKAEEALELKSEPEPEPEPGPQESAAQATDAVRSAHTGQNADLIAEVARLYLKPGARIADVTYGQGRWWRRCPELEVIGSDIDPAQSARLIADFRALPYADGSMDIVVLDPPYSHNSGTANPHDYGAPTTRYNGRTTAALYNADIMDLYRAAWPKPSAFSIPTAAAYG